MKVLILGGAGMLGHQIWLKCLETFGPENVGCTLRKSRSHYDRFNVFNKGHVFEKVDVSQFQELQKILESFRPDYIINCVGLTLRKPELKDLETCVEVNSMLPHRLSLWAQSHNARVIHFSTDCVFNGKGGPYSEVDLPTAEDLYGKSKFLGEIHSANALTFRLSIVGRELEGKTELVEWFLSQKGKQVSGYSEVIYSGLTTNYVAAEVTKVLQKYPTLSGVFQISSEPISKYDLLRLLNEYFTVKATIEKSATYHSNKALNCELYSKVTGFQAPTWKQMLLDLSKDNKINYDL